MPDSKPSAEAVRNWLLACLSSSDAFPLTQDFIAEMLGVRRAGITTAAARFKQEGLISCSRRHFTILDRGGLEQYSCECYMVVREELQNYLTTIAPHLCQHLTPGSDAYGAVSREYSN